MSAVLSQLHLRCPAQRDRPKSMRHAVGAFLDVLEVASDARDDILTAIGEALINAVEHGFLDRPRPEGRGFGLRVIEAIALRLSIEVGDATRVHMVFIAPRAEHA